MIIAIAADHAGRPLVDTVADVVRTLGHEPLLVGPPAGESAGPTAGDSAGSARADDYPDIARAVGAAVVEGRAERGIALCGSGAGVSVAASKMRGVRAAVAHDHYTAHQMVEHDAMNVLAIGARVIGSEVAAEIVAAFVGATFSGEDRHVRRLDKVLAMEAAGR
ncbi:MAG: hypothetical protein NVSMB16_15840 [Acidimicrobiales bacterium]